MPHEKTISMPIFQSASVTMPDSGVLEYPKLARRPELEHKAYSHGKHAHRRTEHAYEHLPSREARGHYKHRGVEDGIRHVAEKEHDRRSGYISPEGAKASYHGQAPPATSLMGMMGIIEHPSAGRDRDMGIPGIISSTSLGPHQRQNIVAGIIEDPMGGPTEASGPVHNVTGHDATAYEAGMIHIPGAPRR